VAEPERDGRAVDAGLEQMHGGGVAKDVGRDVLFPETWAALGRDGDRFVEDVADAGTSQGRATSIGERRPAGGAVQLLEPSGENTRGLGPQRDAPLLAALAGQGNLRWLAEGRAPEDVGVEPLLGACRSKALVGPGFKAGGGEHKGDRHGITNVIS
jgi:hypothetical protein